MPIGGDPQGGMGMGDPNFGQGENPMAPVEGGTDDQGQSEFDTNFDAGVQADEDTDPKKYIQQLTGKLSTTLNSYNNENGDDEGLNKYVGKMIIKQAAKHMSPADRKELIKAVNMADQDEEPSEESEENEMDLDSEE